MCLYRVFLSIYLSVSPLWKAKFHQTLCYHNQCFDKCLFTCTCLNIYFCRIFLGFVSRRQITDSLHICILNFQWYFPKCLSWYFSTPAKRTVFSASVHPSQYLMLRGSLMFALFVVVEWILIRWQCDMIQFNRCELFVGLVPQMPFFQIVIRLLILSLVPLDWAEILTNDVVIRTNSLLYGSCFLRVL